MIEIHRKVLFVKVCNRYFDRCIDFVNERRSIMGFSHSLEQREGLQPFQTVHIDLEKTESELFSGIEKENRRQIRKAEKQNMQFVVLEQPSDAELKKFQLFYNRFAKLKRTNRCRSFHVNTMRKLAQKNALAFTYMGDEENKNVYCYRIYVTDGDFAMTLYSASNHNVNTSSEEKRQMSEANRYLIWKNIMRFKKKGVRTLDMGGLTDKPSIQKFKTGFGGEVVTVYSGYMANSFVGKFIIYVRKKFQTKGQL